MRRYVVLAVAGAFFMLSVVALIVAALVTSASPADNTQAAIHSRKGISFMEKHLYRAAISEFEAAAEKSPNALDPWVGLTAVYIRLGDAGKALEGAGKAADLARDSADVQLILGRASWMARNLNDAESAALKVQKRDPSNLQAAELLLHIYFDRGDDEQFRAVLDRTDRPNRAIQDLSIQFALRDSQFRLAYELRNRYDRKETELRVLRTRLALQREPDSGALYPSLIKDLVRLGRFEEAIAARREYRGSEPLDLELAKAYWMTGQREEAIQLYERASRNRVHKLSAEVALAAITGDQRHWTEAFRSEWIEKDYFVLAQLEDLLSTGSALEKAFIYRYAGLYDPEFFNKAAKEALTVLDQAPDHFDALMTIGTAYFRLGRVDDAIRYVTQATEHYGDRAEVWSRLGQFALAKGDPAGAEMAFGKAVFLAPDNASYLYNYGWLLDETGRDDEAIPFYERAIAKSPLSFEAMNNLALIEAVAGKVDRGLTLLNQAVDSNRENETAYINRGNYHADLQRWREALADYRRASELNPRNPFPFLESARIHMGQNRVDIAIEEISAALEVDPGSIDGYELLSEAYKRQGRETEAAAAREEVSRIKGS